MTLNDVHPLLGGVSASTRSPAEIDALYSALTHEYRRAVLDCLSESEGCTTVADLARQLAATDDPSITATAAGESELSVRIQLHHVHLPLLDDLGLVQYDAVRKSVSLTDTPRTAANPPER